MSVKLSPKQIEYAERLAVEAVAKLDHPRSDDGETNDDIALDIIQELGLSDEELDDTFDMIGMIVYEALCAAEDDGED